MLMWSSTATRLGSVARCDWLIPPGYRLVSARLHRARWRRAARGRDVDHHLPRRPLPHHLDRAHLLSVGSLLVEIITHLHDVAPEDHSRPVAEALRFELLTPPLAHHIHVTRPADPRARAITQQLIAHLADQRELTAWARHVLATVRTLSRLFRAETRLNFAARRTQVRSRAAILILADGVSVNATAGAVGYREPSAFIAAFRRVTGQAPGTYLSPLR